MRKNDYAITHSGSHFFIGLCYFWVYSKYNSFNDDFLSTYLAAADVATNFSSFFLLVRENIGTLRQRLSEPHVVAAAALAVSSSLVPPCTNAQKEKERREKKSNNFLERRKKKERYP